MMGKLTKILIVLLSVSILFIVLLLNRDIEKSTVIINPQTKERVLPNGQVSQVKVNTPSVENPTDAGFTKKYINDTIKKILKVKEKEILTINQIKGQYKDSLNFVKEELDSNQRLIKYYESKDKSGNITGTVKIINDTVFYKGNISLTTVLKKGKKVDSLIFYDPSQRVTINESKEYSVKIPKRTKINISTQIGVGAVIPEFKKNKITYGGYAGIGVSIKF
jgi:hypothetical protein